MIFSILFILLIFSSVKGADSSSTSSNDSPITANASRNYPKTQKKVLSKKRVEIEKVIYEVRQFGDECCSYVQELESKVCSSSQDNEIRKLSNKVQTIISKDFYYSLEVLAEKSAKFNILLWYLYFLNDFGGNGGDTKHLYSLTIWSEYSQEEKVLIASIRYFYMDLITTKLTNTPGFRNPKHRPNISRIIKKFKKYKEKLIEMFGNMDEAKSSSLSSSID